MEIRKRFKIDLLQDNTGPSIGTINLSDLKKKAHIIKQQLTITGRCKEPLLIIENNSIFLEYTLINQEHAKSPDLCRLICDANHKTSEIHSLIKQGKTPPPMSATEAEVVQHLLQTRMNLPKPVSLIDENGEKIELTPLEKINLEVEAKEDRGIARIESIHITKLLIDVQTADMRRLQLRCTNQHIETLMTQKEIQTLWDIAFSPLRSILNTQNQNLDGRLISLSPVASLI